MKFCISSLKFWKLQWCQLIHFFAYKCEVIYLQRTMVIPYWLQKYYKWIILFLLKEIICQSLSRMLSNGCYLLCVFDISITCFWRQQFLTPFKQIWNTGLIIYYIVTIWYYYQFCLATTFKGFYSNNIISFISRKVFYKYMLWTYYRCT